MAGVVERLADRCCLTVRLAVTQVEFCVRGACCCMQLSKTKSPEGANCASPPTNNGHVAHALAKPIASRSLITGKATSRCNAAMPNKGVRTTPFRRPRQIISAGAFDPTHPWAHAHVRACCAVHGFATWYDTSATDAAGVSDMSGILSLVSRLSGWWCAWGRLWRGACAASFPSRFQTLRSVWRQPVL